MINYQQVPSPNFGYPRNTHGQNNPVAIFWHITASPPTATPLAGLDSWFQNPDAEASSHLGIQDGEVHQYVAFEDAAWANGKLASPDLSNPHVKKWSAQNINPNTETISIEVVAMPGTDDVLRGQHDVSDATWAMMVKVGRDLCERFPNISPSANDFCGHWQVDSETRDRDPKSVYWPADVALKVAGKILPALQEDDMAAFVKLSPAQADPNDPDRVWAIGLHTKRKMHGERPDLAAQLGIPDTVTIIDKATLDALTEVP